MYVLIKDHKVVGEGENPKTRPVVSSMNGINVHLSNLISEVLEPLADKVGVNEVTSSEDMLATIDKLNKEFRNTEVQDLDDLVLIGADAEQLYPSLQKEISAKISAEELMKSDLTYQYLKWKEMARYLFLTMNEREHSDWKVSK